VCVRHHRVGDEPIGRGCVGASDGRLDDGLHGTGGENVREEDPQKRWANHARGVAALARIRHEIVAGSIRVPTRVNGIELQAHGDAQRRSSQIVSPSLAPMVLPRVET
jgi:hypothetical protein